MESFRLLKLPKIVQESLSGLIDCERCLYRQSGHTITLDGLSWSNFLENYRLITSSIKIKGNYVGKIILFLKSSSLHHWNVAAAAAFKIFVFFNLIGLLNWYMNH